MSFTNREKAICILSQLAALKVNPSLTILVFKDTEIDEDTLRQAVLDLDEFHKQVKGNDLIKPNA